MRVLFGLSNEPHDTFRAAPGEGEASAAMAVVMNDGAAIAETIALETHA